MCSSSITTICIFRLNTAYSHYQFMMMIMMMIEDKWESSIVWAITLYTALRHCCMYWLIDPQLCPCIYPEWIGLTNLYSQLQTKEQRAAGIPASFLLSFTYKIPLFKNKTKNNSLLGLKMRRWIRHLSIPHSWNCDFLYQGEDDYWKMFSPKKRNTYLYWNRKFNLQCLRVVTLPSSAYPHLLMRLSVICREFNFARNLRAYTHFRDLFICH